MDRTVADAIADCAPAGTEALNLPSRNRGLRPMIAAAITGIAMLAASSAQAEDGIVRLKFDNCTAE